MNRFVALLALVLIVAGCSVSGVTSDENASEAGQIRGYPELTFESDSTGEEAWMLRTFQWYVAAYERSATGIRGAIFKPYALINFGQARPSLGGEDGRTESGVPVVLVFETHQEAVDFFAQMEASEPETVVSVYDEVTAPPAIDPANGPSPRP